MSDPEQLAVALTLVACAGLNVYMTGFLLGLAVRMGWFGDAAPEGLGWLAEPWWLGVTGGLYLIDFVIDKVPRLNTWWNWAHTVVRPWGGALIAMGLIGGAAPVAVGALVALVVHTAHGGLRHWINKSPEPFSNVAASVGRDLLVLGGFTLALRNATGAGIATLMFALVCAIYATRVLRGLAAAWKSTRRREEGEAAGAG